MIFLTSHICLAQHGEQLDVSQCFPQMWVDSRVDINKTKLRWAFLSVWNRQLFEATHQRKVVRSVAPISIAATIRKPMDEDF